MEENILLWNPTAGFCSKLLELDDLTREGNIMLEGLYFDFSTSGYKTLHFIYYVYLQYIKNRKLLS